MKVLLVAYPFATVGQDAVGGAEQVLSMLDRALVEDGHRVIVLACSGSATSGELVAHSLPADAMDDDARDRTHAAVRANIRATLRTTSIDIVHMHGIDFAAYLPPPRPPCLITLHLPPDWYPPEALSPSRPNTWLHCVSAAQHGACRPSANLLAPIINGVPVQALAAHRHSPRGFALALGRVCPEKGQHIALDAAHEAGVALLLGGAVFPYATHRSYFATEILPRLDRHRRWLGPLGFARKRRMLSAARCLLVPSLAAETSSLVAMESLACGTPVIAFPAGALPELIEHGRTGFLVQDTAEMAQAIHRAGDIDRETCRGVARARFSNHRMTASYLDRYAALSQHLRVSA